MKVNRMTIIKAIDIVAFILFVFLTSTGMLMHYVIPPKSGKKITIWDMTRHDWGQIHFYIAVAFFAVLVIHLYLHRQFIVNLFRGTPGDGSVMRLSLGIVGLAVLLILAISLFLSA